MNYHENKVQNALTILKSSESRTSTNCILKYYPEFIQKRGRDRFRGINSYECRLIQSKISLYELGNAEKLLFKFDSLNEFWTWFEKDNWWSRYPREVHPLLRFKIFESIRQIRSSKELSTEEVKKMNFWLSKVLDEKTFILTSLIKRKCPICKSELMMNQRVPNSICSECVNSISDEKGRKVFISMWGGYYRDNKAVYLHHFGFIENNKILPRTGPMDSYFFVVEGY